MKKLLSTSIVLLFCANFLFAQTDRYIAAMTNALADFNSSQNKIPVREKWQALANQFERIASEEPNEWLPRYYAAFAYNSLAFVENDMTQKEQLANKAESLLTEAMAIAGENSEILVLDAQIHQARLAADPVMRWQTEGPLFTASLEKAKKMDSDNPRIYMLEGTNLLYTPEQFGGGKKVAKPILEKAMEKFANFQPQSLLHPTWGQGQARYLLNEAVK